MPDFSQHTALTLETYKELFDSAHDLIHILEPDGRIIHVNNAWKSLFGYTMAELEGQSIYAFVQEQDRDRFIRYREEIVSGIDDNAQIIIGMITKGGAVIYLEGFVSVKFVTGQAVYTRGIFRDITARLRNEAKLKSLIEQLDERKSNLQQLLFHAPDAIIVVDTESMIRYWNPKAEFVFGWNAEHVLGKSLTEVIIPPQHRSAHDEGMKRYLETGETRVLNRTIEITALNKDNKEFYVALTISATVQNGKPAFISFLRDIDEQKRNEAELARKTIQLERSNQQLEQFAHVASHDMKEPIRKITLFAERVETDRKNTLSEMSRESINKIQKSAARLANMVDGVLAHSSLKGEEFAVEKLDLQEIIRSVETDLELTFQQKEATLAYRDLPVIEGAPFLIYQLFYNLINNSLKFTRQDIKPVVEIAASRISVQTMREHGKDESVPYYEIVFSDNGIGFPQEYAMSIFDTFSRLHPKDQFEGTGLGLSLCKTIVEKHKGVIEAYGKENVGATFRILLPEFQNNKSPVPPIAVK